MREGLQSSEAFPEIAVQAGWPIFICIDPTGGGDSKLALASFAIHKGQFIVVSFDFFQSPNQSIRAVHSHTKS